MRTEKEMLALILGFAENDGRVRAVAMEGSRADPTAKRDCFQDYDATYFVTDMDSFKANPHWIDIFGERVILQTPEDMELFPPELGNWFTYLMQFCDGTRIDMSLIPVDEVGLYCESEPLHTVLLDKDGLFAQDAPPEGYPYNIKRPTARTFWECCNEFFWVSTYVAKGLWREELLFANHHLEAILRPMLQMMLEWQAGAAHDFKVSAGKCGKHLRALLPPEDWGALCATYRADGADACWASLEGCMALFRRSARRVAGALGFDNYPKQDDARVTAFIAAVKAAAPGRPPDFSGLCP